MSKAFTREVDDAPERNARTRQSSGLPPDAQNLMTADGAQRLRDELDRLLLEDRPRAARLADPEERAREMAHLNQRIVEVQGLLRSATIVPPLTEAPGTVCFGATVEFRGADGRVSKIRVVGVDETDPERGWVSWLSPLARALLGASCGQRISLPTERGEEVVEVVEIGGNAR